LRASDGAPRAIDGPVVATHLYLVTRHAEQQTRADTSATECAESKECHPAKHHYDECAARVTGQIENDGKASEDCVEECKSRGMTTHEWLLTTPVFHLAHCAAACAAPKLFAQLK
jgi:hypothetical protein